MEVKALTVPALKCVGGRAVIAIQRIEQPARCATGDTHLVDNVLHQKTFPLIVITADFRNTDGL